MPVTKTKNRICGSKPRFADREGAVQERERLIARGSARGTVGAYLCKHCRKFHTGHRRVDGATRGGRRR